MVSFKIIHHQGIIIVVLVVVKFGCRNYLPARLSASERVDHCILTCALLWQDLELPDLVQ